MGTLSPLWHDGCQQLQVAACPLRTLSESLSRQLNAFTRGRRTRSRAGRTKRVLPRYSSNSDSSLCPFASEGQASLPESLLLGESTEKGTEGLLPSPSRSPRPGVPRTVSSGRARSPWASTPAALSASTAPRAPSATRLQVRPPPARPQRSWWAAPRCHPAPTPARSYLSSRPQVPLTCLAPSCTGEVSVPRPGTTTDPLAAPRYLAWRSHRTGRLRASGRAVLPPLPTRRCREARTRALLAGGRFRQTGAASPTSLGACVPGAAQSPACCSLYPRCLPQGTVVATALTAGLFGAVGISPTGGPVGRL